MNEILFYISLALFSINLYSIIILVIFNYAVPVMDTGNLYKYLCIPDTFFFLLTIVFYVGVGTLHNHINKIARRRMGNYQIISV